MPTNAVVPFSFQFDILKGITLTAHCLSKLLDLCVKDEIQPLVIPPLELFGQLLQADNKRVQAGYSALKHHTLAIWKPGLRVASPELRHLISEYPRLISVFLFSVGCSVCFSVPLISEIVYEMMRLSGALNEYNVTSEVVFQFLENINGHREGFTSRPIKDTPGPVETYDNLCADAMAVMRRLNVWIRDLYSENDTKFLASLLHRVFEAAEDQDNELIILEGSRGGLWISFILCWLRPAETTVFLADEQLFPTETPNHPQLEGHTNVRFAVYLSEKMPSGWSFKVWHTTGYATSPIRIENSQPGPQSPSNVLNGRRVTNAGLPWANARQQIELINSQPSVVLAIGYFAAALVQVATENGCLTTNTGNGKTAVLINICPMWYLDEYMIIMEKFGWKDLNADHQRNIATIIDEVRPKIIDNAKDMNCFYSLIRQCNSRYTAMFHEPMLADVPEGVLEKHVIEHAVHLAAQVIEMVIFRQLPQWPIYRPLDHEECSKSAATLRPLIIDAGNYEPRMAKVINIVSRGIRAVIPSARLNLDYDLAYAGEGYVCFRSALSREDIGPGSETKDVSIQLDNQREVWTYELLPGRLQYLDEPGNFRRLAEDPPSMSRTKGTRNPDAPRVQLFADDGGFQGISEDFGRELSRPYCEKSVRYLLRKDDVEKTIFLTTQFSASEDSTGVKSGPRCDMPICHWRMSIEKILLSHHIQDNRSSLAQLEALASVWATGTEEEQVKWFKLDWKPEDKGRHIMATTGNPEGRFFAAGCVDPKRQIFVRHRGVPLTHCVKVAMECEKSWVIIA